MMTPNSGEVRGGFRIVPLGHGVGQRGRWQRQGRNIALMLDGEQGFDGESNFESWAEGVLGEVSMPTLRKGSKGAAVSDLQTRLNAWIATGAASGMRRLAVDGDFGPLTDAAVRAYQLAKGLTADGIVGPQTWGSLLGSASRRPPSGATAATWVLPADVRAAGEAQKVHRDGALRWKDDKSSCSPTGRLLAGTEELGGHIQATFPGVDGIDGYNCRPDTADKAYTSVHGTGRAFDITIDTIGGRANSAVGDPIANWLVRNTSDIGVQYIIWNRTQWSGRKDGRKDSPYPGPHPHTDHIHVELNNDGAARLTPWFKRRGGNETALDAILREVSSASQPILRKGSRSSAVKDLQTRLNAWIATGAASGMLRLAVDGDFGSLTDAAVRTYQRAKGLTVDGIVGQQTWGSLLGQASGGQRSVNAAHATVGGSSGSAPHAVCAPRTSRGCSTSLFAPGSTAPLPPDVGKLLASIRAILGGLPAAGLGKTGVVVPSAARFLDAPEQREAKTVFGGSLDFAKILIVDGLGFQGRPFTVAVPLSSGYYVAMLVGDLCSWATKPCSCTLIHELAHAWQSQHHVTNPTAYMANSVMCQARAIAEAPIAKAEAASKAAQSAIRRGVLNPVQLARIAKAAADAEDVSAYAYLPGRAFGSYAAEQIAQQVQDSYCGRGSPTPSLVATIRSLTPYARSLDNERGLQVISVHRKSTPGVVFR